MTVAVNNPSLDLVVSALCVRAGLSTSQFDVSALASITRPLQGMALSQIASTRQYLEVLMTMFFFEMTVSDKIYFKPRGAASVASIPYLDLGASKSEDQPEPLALREQNELEVPAQVAVTYINVTDDYQSDTQISDRLISAAEGTVANMQIAVGMTPSEAKLVADAVLLDQAVSRLTTSIALLGDYCALEPTDPVTITGADGSTFRMRLVKRTDSYPLLMYDAVLEDVSVLTSPGTTSEDYNSSVEVVAAPATLMELMDIPILLDADNDSGLYVATKGDSTAPYAGAAILDSPSGITYTREGTTDSAAVFGTCVDLLGPWSGPRVFDEINTVTVDVGNGTLSSTTRDALLNDASVNAALIGDELLQFRTASLVSAGVYTLSGLLRGGRGTEWAMGAHVASPGERFVLLEVGPVTRIPIDNSALGLSRFFKGVTLGEPLSSATAQTLTPEAVGLKPFSPVDVRGSRDGSNNLTVTWQRRSRLGVRMIGALGINVPLGEASERYEVDVYAGSPLAVVRTISATSPTVTYSAADQTSDGIAPGAPVFLKAYQLSDVVGRGYPVEQTV